MMISSTLKAAIDEKLPKFSDKVILPQNVLSEIILAFGEGDLPHPIVFKLSNGKETCYVGVKEFSDDNYLKLPELIWEKLRLEDDVYVRADLVTNIPKGTYLSLQPLAFYPQVSSWKYFLESNLTNYYTVLHKGDILKLEYNDYLFELKILSVGEDCDIVNIIDTDLVLDVVPLNDIMAHQQLEFNDKSYVNSIEHITKLDLDHPFNAENLKPFTSSDFKPIILQFDTSQLNARDTIIFTISVPNSTSIEDLMNIDLLIGYEQLTNLENFKWSTIPMDSTIQIDSELSDSFPGIKHISLSASILQKNKDTLTEDWSSTNIYIIPFAWRYDTNVFIEVSKDKVVLDNSYDGIEGKVLCKNCKKPISENKVVLHEAFCFRNNVICKCGAVFLKKIPSTHWHCEVCNVHGNDGISEFKHNKIFHNSPYKCTSCSDETVYKNYLDLVSKHKSSDCSAKLHKCRFCQLIVPQGEPTYQDRYQNVTNHESACGNKTTECYICSKIVRLKDISTHMKMHDLEKTERTNETRANFKKCSNENCVYLLSSQGARNELDLCDLCYGPLYSQLHDPTHVKLQSRIERKYMIQLGKGCGHLWCQNLYCKTAYPEKFESMGSKEILAFVRDNLMASISKPLLPMNKQAKLSSENTFWFCVNESTQRKKNIFTMLALENRYEDPSIYKALNEVADASPETVSSWLAANVRSIEV
ncbi:Piso0_003537 [Millerozyma farinosa CBS 7064]|uniref:Piso0_003537 protein n=1 Tax=Pichia sorbitophila (strain ATCC MYA-4447 / BCRC 22081 / CBS 7064 / NBRC 10061 / NRRL Y-12695) TaxID=559304 RepID=G8YID4_PICSO|nr:Piso0_003537 [Millerozyma farinosa CBS 7064]CCE81186.1 Piso0_003537 [Millerozyma farinosa CBS 7064]